jgi:hypothetical protein
MNNYQLKLSMLVLDWKEFHGLLMEAQQVTLKSFNIHSHS